MLGLQLSASVFLLSRHFLPVPVETLVSLYPNRHAFHTLKEYFTPSQTISAFDLN